jgi:hypothetical protein
MKTLIQRQEACIARMNEPRTSERRAAKNRAAAIRDFRKQCAAVGYDKPSIDLITQDVRDMYELEKLADECNDETFDATRELAELKQFEEEQACNELKTLLRCLDPYNGCL